MPISRRQSGRTAVLAILLAACGRSGDAPKATGESAAGESAAAAAGATAGATADAPITPATPAALPAGALARLRWITGTWRGSGDQQPAFYERYRFADDSTLLVDAFEDSTLARVNETTRFELRGGTLGNPGEGPRWVAVKLDSASVTFAPVAKARNTFTWRRDSADVWTALLSWPASAPGGARERTYRMARVAAPAARTAVMQGRWLEIGKTSSGNPVFVDPKSVKTENGIVTATVRVQFVEPVATPKGAYTSARTVAMFDCAKRVVAVKENTYYLDEKKNRVGEHKVVGMPGFGTVIRGTLPDVALGHVCAQ